MALQDLNRASDTTGDGQTAISKPTTFKLSDITPVNWHRFPPRVGSMTDANANEAKPRHDSMTDWAGGVRGDDVDQATATVALARADGAGNETDYIPRTQQAKATLTGNTMAVDVARPRGWISPSQPYQGNSSAPAAPVVSSLSPSTGAAVTLPLMVTITGTGFTPYSTVLTGGSNVPDASAVYINATTMRVPIWRATPGTVSVAVEDHNVLSNTDKIFTVT